MNKDKIGIFLSASCMIHCVVTPILLPVLPIFGLAAKHESTIHLVLSALVTVMAAFTLKPGVTKHRDFIVAAAGSISLLLLISSGIFEAMGGSMTIWTIIGSLGLIYAHYRNHKLSCACDCEHKIV